MTVTVVLSPIDFVDEFPKRVFTMGPDLPLVNVGRSSKNTAKNLNSGRDNAFFDSPVMSREHAKIWIDDPRLYIVDSGSMHGTFMDHKPLTKRESYPLAHGAVVTFGCRVTRGSDSFPARSFRITYQWKDWKPPRPKTISSRTVFRVPESFSDDDLQEGNLDDEGPQPVCSGADDFFVPQEERTSSRTPIERSNSVELVFVKEIKSLDQATSDEAVCSAAVASRAFQVPESDTSPSRTSDSFSEIYDGTDVQINNRLNAENSGVSESTESAPEEHQVSNGEAHDQSQELQAADDRESNVLDGSKENPLVIDEGVEMRKRDLPDDDDDKPEKHPALSLSHVLISADSPRSDSAAKGIDYPDFTLVDTSPDTPSSDYAASNENLNCEPTPVDSRKGRDLSDTQERLEGLAEYHRLLALLCSPRPATTGEKEESYITEVSDMREPRVSAAGPAIRSDGHGLQPILAPISSGFAQQDSRHFPPIITKLASDHAYHNNNLATMRFLSSSHDITVAPGSRDAANPDPSYVTSPRERSNGPPGCKQTKLSDIARALRLPPGIASAPTSNANGDAFGNGRTEFNGPTISSVLDSDSQALERVFMQQELSDVVGCFDRNEICLDPYNTSFDSMKELLRRPTESSPPRLPSMPQSAHGTQLEDPSIRNVGNHAEPIDTTNVDASYMVDVHGREPSLRPRVVGTGQLPSATPVTSTLKRKATDECPVLSDGKHHSSLGRARVDFKGEQPRTNLPPRACLDNHQDLKPVEMKLQSKRTRHQVSAAGPPPRKRVRTPDSSTGWLATARSTAKLVAGATAAGFGVFAYLAISNPDPI